MQLVRCACSIVCDIYTPFIAYSTVSRQSYRPWSQAGRHVKWSVMALFSIRSRNCSNIYLETAYCVRYLWLFSAYWEMLHHYFNLTCIHSMQFTSFLYMSGWHILTSASLFCPYMNCSCNHVPHNIHTCKKRLALVNLSTNNLIQGYTNFPKI